VRRPPIPIIGIRETPFGAAANRSGMCGASAVSASHLARLGYPNGFDAGDFYLGPPSRICFDARVTGAVLRPLKATRYAGVLRAALTGLSRRFWDGRREMG
jgi:hypothetical protein